MTAALLHKLQRELLGRYPLWRVLFMADSPSCGVAVYPTAIRVGNHAANADIGLALRQIAPEVAELRADRQRPARRHLDVLKRLIKDSVRQIGVAPFWLSPPIDNFAGDYGRLTIPLLLRGADRDAFVIKAPPDADKDLLCRSGQYGVDLSGEIVSYLGCGDDATPFCLVQWLPPADYRGPLTVVDTATGRSVAYEVNEDSVVRTAPQV